MKQIKESMIRKLIKIKLQERYQKLLTEQTNNLSNEQLNQLKTSIILEAIYIAFNDDIVEIDTDISSAITRQIDTIFKSTDSNSFKNNVLNLCNILTQNKQVLLELDLFKYIVNNIDDVISELNSNLTEVINNNVYNASDNQPVTIFNHIKNISTNPFKYNLIKGKLNELITAYASQSVNVSNPNLNQIFKQLFPVLENVSLNNNNEIGDQQQEDAKEQQVQKVEKVFNQLTPKGKQKFKSLFAQLKQADTSGEKEEIKQKITTTIQQDQNTQQNSNDQQQANNIQTPTTPASPPKSMINYDKTFELTIPNDINDDVTYQQLFDIFTDKARLNQATNNQSTETIDTFIDALYQFMNGNFFDYNKKEFAPTDTLITTIQFGEKKVLNSFYKQIITNTNRNVKVSDLLKNKIFKNKIIPKDYKIIVNQSFLQYLKLIALQQTLALAKNKDLRTVNFNEINKKIEDQIQNLSNSIKLKDKKYEIINVADLKDIQNLQQSKESNQESTSSEEEVAEEEATEEVEYSFDNIILEINSLDKSEFSRFISFIYLISDKCANLNNSEQNNFPIKKNQSNINFQNFTNLLKSHNLYLYKADNAFKNLYDLYFPILDKLNKIEYTDISNRKQAANNETDSYNLLREILNGCIAGDLDKKIYVDDAKQEINISLYNTDSRYLTFTYSDGNLFTKKLSDLTFYNGYSIIEPERKEDEKDIFDFEKLNKIYKN